MKSQSGFAELDIIVARSGDPHIEHRDRIVVVAEPAVTSDGEVAGLTGGHEGRPILILERHLDAVLIKGTLEILSNGLMAFAGVVEVFEARNVGELLARLIVGITGRFKISDARFDVRGKGSIGVRDIVPAFPILLRTIRIGPIAHTVGAGKALRDEAVSRLL